MYETLGKRFYEVWTGTSRQGKGRHGLPAEPIITFLMTNRAPECLYLFSGTDDTMMNALIIYKAPLAQSWNPET